jgi:diguanylate cyclase (GGDEF)-like protein
MADAYVACVTLLLAVAVGFMADGGPGRFVELGLVGAALLVAYLLPWGAGRLVGILVVAAYLLLELHYGRLHHAEFWRQVFYSAGILGAATSSAYLRLTIETRNQGLGEALAEIGELRSQDELVDRLHPRKISPLEVELERARRYNHSMSLIVVRPDDIDDVAARYGELGSAEALGEVAEAIGRNLRATDEPRLDEPFGFVVVLPETTRDAARVVSERIRLDVGRRRLDFGPGELVNLSVTIGSATFPEDALTNDELIAAARRAFSAGLELGGNRTVLASAPGDTPKGWAIERDAPVAEPLA